MGQYKKKEEDVCLTNHLLGDGAAKQLFQAAVGVGLWLGEGRHCV